MHNSSSDFVFQGQTASILSYSISQFPDKKEVSAQMACFYAQASRYFVDLLKNDFDSLGRLLKWWRCIFTRDNEKHRTSFLAQVSPAAAERLTVEFEKAAKSLEQMPQRCPWLKGEYIPKNAYRFILFEKRYMLISQIVDNTVYADYVVDCRQDYDWLIR